MLQRYSLFEIEHLSKRFFLPNGVPSGTKKNYNISPTQSAPVIVSVNGVRSLKPMIWGFVPRGAKNQNAVFRYKTYNVKSDTIFSKTTYQATIRTHRCLIPSNGYYAWTNGSSEKQRVYFVRPQDQKLFSLAGVYSTWTDTHGTLWEMFSVVTCPANKEIRATIDTRMPVILREDQEEAWLDETIDDMNSLYDMMRHYPNGAMTFYEVGDGINSTKPNMSSLLIKK